VCGVSDALNTLSDLVDRSLVVVERRTSDRVLGTGLLLVIAIRARATGTERRKATSCDRVVAVGGGLGGSIAPHSSAMIRPAWMQRIEVEQDNWRARCVGPCTSHQVDTGLRLANALWRYWSDAQHAERRPRVVGRH